MLVTMAMNSAISHLSPSPSPSSLNLTKSPPTRTTSLSKLQNFVVQTTPSSRWSPQKKSHLKLSSSQNQTAIVASPATDVTAAEVVRKFYAGINGRDLPSVEDLISQSCVYEDLIFARPFVGRKDIIEFFENFGDVLSDKDLQFVIDKISTEDSSAVGVTWHLEWKGKPFPFSKGCSFYQLEVVNGKRQIIYARDSVEPAIKPGKAALVIIRGVTWLLQQFPKLADRF